MSAHDDYRHAAFTRAYGTVGRAATLDGQSAIAALVPLQEWEWPESHRPDLAAIRDRAAEARHGGRYITGALAKMAHHHPEAFRLFQDGDGRMATRAWLHYLSPAGSIGSGRDTTASLAQGRARGYDAAGDGSLSASQAEAMLDWPVYRVATGRGISTLTCACGHLFVQHQTGDGPWTGFCGGTLAEAADMDDNDPDEPCACEAPVTPERQAAQIASIRERMA